MPVCLAVCLSNLLLSLTNDAGRLLTCLTRSYHSSWQNCLNNHCQAQQFATGTATLRGKPLKCASSPRRHLLFASRFAKMSSTVWQVSSFRLNFLLAVPRHWLRIGFLACHRQELSSKSDLQSSIVYFKFVCFLWKCNVNINILFDVDPVDQSGRINALGLYDNSLFF